MALEELLRKQAEPMGAYDKIKNGEFSYIEIDRPDLTEESLIAIERYKIDLKTAAIAHTDNLQAHSLHADTAPALFACGMWPPPLSCY